MSKFDLWKIVFGRLRYLHPIDMGAYVIYPDYHDRESNHYERRITIYYKIDSNIPFDRGNMSEGNINHSKTETFTIRITEHRK